MSKKRTKTVIRSIRITEQLNQLLENDAKTKNLSVNALINTIFSKYSEWDRFAEKLDLMTVQKDFIKTLLALVDEPTVRRIARKFGSHILKDNLLFFFKEVSVDAFLAYVSNQCRYASTAEHDISKTGNHYTITANHGLGEKWSIFLKEFVLQGMKHIGVEPEVEITERTVVIKFAAPHDVFRDN